MHLKPGWRLGRSVRQFAAVQADSRISVKGLIGIVFAIGLQVKWNPAGHKEKAVDRNVGYLKVAQYFFSWIIRIGEVPDNGSGWCVEG